MKILSKQLARSGTGVEGVTLIELLIVLAIMGIFVGLVVGQSLSALRREKINAVALALAGWVEEVRNISTKKVGSVSSIAADPALAACSITFIASANSLQPGAKLASVASATVTADEQTNCAPRSNGTTSISGEFRLPPDIRNSISYSPAQASLTEPAKITYTPRGMWTPQTSPSVATGDLTIKLLLDGGGPMRCVRVSETLGFVDIGQASTSSISDTCTDYTRF